MQPHKIYLTAIGFLLVMLILMGIHSANKDKQITSYENANAMLNNKIKTHVNAEGKLISEARAAELRSQELVKALPELANALTKQMDIKMRNLRAGVVAEFKALGSGNAFVGRIPYDTSHSFTADVEYWYDASSDKVLHLLPNGDTVELRSFQPFAITTDDGYLHYQADVYSQLNAPYQYNYTDTLTFAFSMKSEKWWKQKQLYGSGKLGNPNAQIINSQAVLINEFKQKRWVVGPSLTYGISADFKPQTIVGISVTYGVIKF